MFKGLKKNNNFLRFSVDSTCSSIINCVKFLTSTHTHKAQVTETIIFHSGSMNLTEKSVILFFVRKTILLTLLVRAILYCGGW